MIKILIAIHKVNMEWLAGRQPGTERNLLYEFKTTSYLLLK